MTSSRMRHAGSRSHEPHADQVPPDDFRHLTVCPTPQEILSTEIPFLRPNITRGPYTGADHYLDVQFRLLKEDFLRPLREGIAGYRNNAFKPSRLRDWMKRPSLGNKYEDKPTLQEERVYGATIFEWTPGKTSADKSNLQVHHPYPLREMIALCRNKSEFIADNPTLWEAREDKHTLRLCTNVTFKDVIFFKDELCVSVMLDPKQDNFENNDKAFMFGSLVLFTRTFFDTMICATVMDSQSTALKKRNLKVKLINNEDLFDINFDESYTLAESVAFFEPYAHVLSALQSMTLETHPLCRYITGEANTTQPPKYASRTTYASDGTCVRVSDVRNLPTAEEVGFYGDQYLTFIGALIQEFAIIQVPRGTGKTRVGVMVAELLVDNAYNTTDETPPPLLVVCATNHALDQFMEKLSFTDKLVRVGNQSTSNKLKPYLLSVQRIKYKQVNSSLAAMAIATSSRMATLLKKISSLIEDRGRLIGYHGIVSLDCLCDIIGSHEARFSDGVLDKRRFAEWLQLERKELGDLTTANSSSTSVVLDIDFNSINVKLNEVFWQWEGIENKKFKSHHQYRDPKANKLSSHLSELQKLYFTIVSRIAKKQKITDSTVATHLKSRAWSLDVNTRWQCYHYWTTLAAVELRRQALDLLDKFNQENMTLKALRQCMDLNVLRGAKVVGMTTSEAARLGPLLDQLKPRTMIVEDAAEVLEGHFVASLTRHCQHVILIGDHQQPRPITSSHDLARDYQLDVSLFERMLNNPLPRVTLNVQQGMRSEDARLISPELMNRSSVLNRDNVRGAHKNVFFITHNQQEQLTPGKGQSNMQVAALLIALGRYLVLQGYEANQISIIAMYAAQVACLEAERSKLAELKEVKMSTVDGYMGEENDIILLSLVCSNPSADMRVLNQVCVALSRARIGLYIVGNTNSLTQEPNSPWSDVNAALMKKPSVGTLPHLQCAQAQHDNMVLINNAHTFNFDNLKEIKCLLRCQADTLIITKPLQVMDLSSGLDVFGQNKKLAYNVSNEKPPSLKRVRQRKRPKEVASSNQKQDSKPLDRPTVKPVRKVQPSDTVVKTGYHPLLQGISKPTSIVRPQITSSSSSFAQEDVLKAVTSKAQVPSLKLKEDPKPLLRPTAKPLENIRPSVQIVKPGCHPLLQRISKTTPKDSPQITVSSPSKTFALEAKTSGVVPPTVSTPQRNQCSQEVSRPVRPLHQASLVCDADQLKTETAVKKPKAVPTPNNRIYPVLDQNTKPPVSRNPTEQIYPKLDHLVEPTVDPAYQPSAPLDPGVEAMAVVDRYWEEMSAADARTRDRAPVAAVNATVLEQLVAECVANKLEQLLVAVNASNAGRNSSPEQGQEVLGCEELSQAPIYVEDKRKKAKNCVIQ